MRRALEYQIDGKNPVGNALSADEKARVIAAILSGNRVEGVTLPNVTTIDDEGRVEPIVGEKQLDANGRIRKIKKKDILKEHLSRLAIKMLQNLSEEEAFKIIITALKSIPDDIMTTKEKEALRVSSWADPFRDSNFFQSMAKSVNLGYDERFITSGATRDALLAELYQKTKATIESHRTPEGQPSPGLQGRMQQVDVKLKDEVKHDIEVAPKVTEYKTPEISPVELLNLQKELNKMTKAIYDRLTNDHQTLAKVYPEEGSLAEDQMKTLDKAISAIHTLDTKLAKDYPTEKEPTIQGMMAKAAGYKNTLETLIKPKNEGGLNFPSKTKSWLISICNKLGIFGNFIKRHFGSTKEATAQKIQETMSPHYQTMKSLRKAAGHVMEGENPNVNPEGEVVPKPPPSPKAAG